jgi:excisionase family DNA binding protein
MAKMGLSEAAAVTGIKRSTIYRAWKAGRMSATRTDTGRIEVDPTELFRVFPPGKAEKRLKGQYATFPATARVPSATDETAPRLAALHAEVKDPKDWLTEVKKCGRVLYEDELMAEELHTPAALVARVALKLARAVRENLLCAGHVAASFWLRATSMGVVLERWRDAKSFRQIAAALKGGGIASVRGGSGTRRLARRLSIRLVHVRPMYRRAKHHAEGDGPDQRWQELARFELRLQQAVWVAAVLILIVMYWLMILAVSP